MNFTVLLDNNTLLDVYYQGEPGLSFYIEDENEKILFDCGYTNQFMHNAKGMGIDLGAVTKIVLSHGHDDHTGGLRPFLDQFGGMELVAHPDALKKKEENGTSIGCPLTMERLQERLKLNLAKEPVKVSENITFLGEIPVSCDFEQRYPMGQTRLEDNTMVDDYLFDDSALVYKSDEGLFIITGCSHSGICNIIEYAKKVCGDDRVVGVIGGFHLLDGGERTKKTAAYLKNAGVQYLFPCHCTSLQAKIEMGKIMDIYEVGVGMDLKL